jgi:hypothetical protein
MAAIMWAGAFRHADLEHVQPSDISAVDDDGTYDITLRVTKTTTFTGQPRVVRIVLPRRVRRHMHHVLRGVLQLPSYRRFLREVKRLCPMLSAHSFRRGAIQAAMDAGIPDEAVMRVSGHKALDSLATYAARLPRLWKEQMASVSRAGLW